MSKTRKDGDQRVPGTSLHHGKHAVHPNREEYYPRVVTTAVLKALYNGQMPPADDGSGKEMPPATIDDIISVFALRHEQKLAIWGYEERSTSLKNSGIQQVGWQSMAHSNPQPVFKPDQLRGILLDYSKVTDTLDHKLDPTKKPGSYAIKIHVEDRTSAAPEDVLLADFIDAFTMAHQGEDGSTVFSDKELLIHEMLQATDPGDLPKRHSKFSQPDSDMIGDYGYVPLPRSEAFMKYIPLQTEQHVEVQNAAWIRFYAYARPLIEHVYAIAFPEPGVTETHEKTFNNSQPFLFTRSYYHHETKMFSGVVLDISEFILLAFFFRVWSGARTWIEEWEGKKKAESGNTVLANRLMKLLGD